MLLWKLSCHRVTFSCVGPMWIFQNDPKWPLFIPYFSICFHIFLYFSISFPYAKWWQAMGFEGHLFPKPFTHGAIVDAPLELGIAKLSRSAADNPDTDHCKQFSIIQLRSTQDFSRFFWRGQFQATLWLLSVSSFLDCGLTHNYELPENNSWNRRDVIYCKHL